MFMVFGRSGMALLVIIGQIILLAEILQLTQSFPLDTNHTIPFDLEKRVSTGGKKTHPGSRTRIYLHSSCAGKESDFATAFNDVLKIVLAAKKAIPTLEKALPKERTKKDAKELKNAQGKLGEVSKFANKYVTALSEDSFRVDVFCTSDVWIDTGNMFRNEHVFTLDGEAIALETYNEDPNICKDEKGKETTMAFITKAKDHSKDYMTICAAMLKLKGRSLPKLKSKSLKSLIGKTLEDSLENTVGNILLHELTHIDSFWRDKALDDATMNDGESAYTFTGVHQLAGDDNNVTIIKKIRPLKNADTFTYFCPGLYLDQCNWRNGICQDPSKVE